MQRRHILQSILLAPVAFVFARNVFAADPKAAAPAKAAAGAAPANLLPETDPMGKAMKYVHDASKADATIRKDKTALCSNCAKYDKCSTVDKTCKPVGKTAAYAPCEIFVGKTVAKGGWCMSWTKA